VDKKTGKRLIDEILDVARQKGTVMWASQSALKLQVPIPTIDLVVAMRDLSVFAKERGQAGSIYLRLMRRFTGDRDTFFAQPRRALYAVMIITYAQGWRFWRLRRNTSITSISKPWRGSGEVAALYAPRCWKTCARHSTRGVICRICCSLPTCRTRLWSITTACVRWCVRPPLTGVFGEFKQEEAKLP
jgi:6-phosphogluconate dehydrogenase